LWLLYPAHRTSADLIQSEALESHPRLIIIPYLSPVRQLSDELACTQLKRPMQLFAMAHPSEHQDLPDVFHIHIITANTTRQYSLTVGNFVYQSVHLS
jgi:hypothetical protein